MRDLLRLLRYVRPYAGRLAAAVACSILVSICYLGLLSLVQPIFDKVFAPTAIGPAATAGKIQFLDQARRLIGAGGRTFEPLAAFARRIDEGSGGTAILIGTLVVVLFVLKGVFTYLGEYLTRWTGLQAVRDLRTDLYARIQRQSLAFFSDHPSGLLIARVMNDVGRIQRTVAGDLAEIFRLAAVVLGQAIWLFYLNGKLATFCLVLLPLIVLPVARFGSRLKATSRRSQERLGDAVGIMKEGIAGTRVVQAFGMEDFEIGRFERALARMQRAEMSAARLMSLSPPVMELVGAIGGAVLFVYANHRVASGKLSPGELVTFIAALFMIYASIKNLMKINNEVQQSMAAARRVFEIIDLPNRIREKPGAIELPPFRERIEFRGVSFTYGQAPVLREIDLKVRSGEVVALVGHSGAGKSTLVNLLSRFYDVNSGAVLIDGHDVRDVTLSSLRRQIGLVTQEVMLFDESVRNNIAYGRADIPLERVTAAARAAHADGFIQALPRAYDTPLGEAGHRLSLGQRQRLSIARAILKDSPILILDEATSSLDSESEAEVQSALRNLISGRTVFVIAHRLSTVRRADTILVLDAGQIVERGSHPDLLARKGVYARLHAMQFRDETPAPEASVL
ncbi:MAG TPA: ABC transporter transmembrane domain-containing protein [Candidatus Polarisedimenticolia bacterium]|nr:ABC transporter transmembrane domain-containing protein [Candidatus Polarisedimenticolia bacterium]